MKENTYDRESFFEKYSHMSRSELGLEGAGEWPALKAMLPDFRGCRVVDLGCGYGWHCRWAIDHGASSVLGIDQSEKMLKRAAELTESSQIEYRHLALEDYEYPAQDADIVLSSLVFHYVEDWDHLLDNIVRTLKDSGVLVFSVEHPVFTAEGSQQWLTDAQGKTLCWPVDRYFEEGWREAVFLGETMTKFHRTLTTYLSSLLDRGMVIEAVCEPQPQPDWLQRMPEMKEELRRPMMLLIRARKGR